MKRHMYQMYENKHKEVKEIRNDDDAINVICDLYDRGVTIQMIKMVFKDIEIERQNDQISDFEVYRL